jgi:hypothetical protein
MGSTLPTFTDIPPQANTIYNMQIVDGTYTVADLTELAALVPQAGDLACIVADIGAGVTAIYRWDSSSAAADDGLLTIAPVSGMNGRWIRGV